MTTVVDRLLEWAWVAVVATFGWAWQVNGRLTRLETRYDALDEKIDALREEMRESRREESRKLDQILGKLR